MMVVCAVAIGAFTGFRSGYLNMERTIGNYVDGYNCADCIVSCGLADASIKEELAALDGVKAVTSRLSIDVPAMREGGKNLTLRVFTTGADDFLRYYVWDSNESATHFNVRLDYIVANANDIKAGDVIWIRLYNAYDAVCVGEIVSAPECAGTQRNEYVYGKDTDFGCLYIPEDAVAGSEYDGLANQFLLLFEDDADREELSQKLKDVVSAHAEVTKLVLYENSTTNTVFSSNLSALKVLSNLIPAVFYGIMLLVFAMFIVRILDQSTRQIGILRANGISSGKIRTLFSGMSLMISVTGSILGFAFGYLIMHILDKRYGDYFPLPEMQFGLDLGNCAIAFAVTLAVGQLAVWLCYGRILRIEPSLAMKPSRVSTEPGGAAKLVPSSMPPFYRAGLISMLRNRKRLAFTIISIAMSFILIFASLSLTFSKQELLKQTYEDRCHYDCDIIAVSKSVAEIEEELVRRGIDGEKEVYLYSVLELAANGMTKTILVQGVRQGSAMISVCNENGKLVAMPASGLVLDSKTAAEFGVGAGDTVQLNGKNIEISMISHQYSRGCNYLNYELAEELGVAAMGLFCRGDDDDALKEALNNIDPDCIASFKAVQEKTLRDTVRLTAVGMWIVLGISLALGMFIVYDATLLNLSDRRKELASLLAQGFERRDISRLWLIQNGISYVVAMIIGLPLGIIFAKSVLGMMSVPICEYPFAPKPLLFVISLALVAAYLAATHFLAMKSLEKWSVPEIIKE